MSATEQRAAPSGDHGPQAPEQEELIHHLERDQLVAETLRTLPRAELSRGAIAALWALRVFAVVLSLMVIYAFIAELQ